MPRTVAIYGTASNLAQTPCPLPGTEVWLANAIKSYNVKRPRSLDEWTRYFNFHSRRHMNATYRTTVNWHKAQDGTRPLYVQRHQPDFPGSIAFPRTAVEAFFPEAMGPGGFYSTCSICWLLPFAIYEGFERIELWGFALSDRKPRDAYKFERPCFFYWVQQARNHGIKVIYQQAVADLPFEPGDPTIFNGPVYGYGTKPED